MWMEVDGLKILRAHPKALKDVSLTGKDSGIYLQPAKIKSQNLGVSFKFLVCN